MEDIGCLRRENRWFLIVISLSYRDNSCSPTFLAFWGPTYYIYIYSNKYIYSTLSSTSEGWRGYTAKEASKGSSWVTEESSDCSVTESERFLPLSLLPSTLGLIILLQQSKLRNESDGNLGLCPLSRFFFPRPFSPKRKEGKDVWEKEF